MRESGYYPPGAEFDPKAPYNQNEEKMEFNEKKYLEHAGNICPFCEGTNINANDSEFEEDCVFQNVNCDDCENEWTDQFKLIGAEPLIK